jgi:acetylglutamate kinase
MGVMARSEIQADDHAIASFRGRTVVVEYGGAAMEQAHLRDGFSRDIAAIRLAGVNPVVVHGGGRRMSRLLEAAERIPRFVGDPRVTPDETMRLVERALATTADEIARLIGRHGVEAVESGVWPGQIVRACRRKPLLPAGESVDLGRVGDVAGVNARPIRALLERGIVPIIGPLGIGADGRTYNIDADLVAGEVAAVLGADLVIYLTDVPGILDRDGRRFRRLSRWAVDSLVREGLIDGRMLPKIEGCVRALKGGAAQAQLVDGRVPHAVPMTLRAPHGVGTEIVL